MPSENIGHDPEIESFSTKGDTNDNVMCKTILGSDPGIRVAALIEGAESQATPKLTGRKTSSAGAVILDGRFAFG